MRISDWSSDVCSSDLPSLALLVRLYDAYPDQVAVFRVPSMAEFHDLLKRQPHSAGVTPYQLSLALGRENSSCYRWLQVAKAKTTPVIDRIVTMLQPKQIGRASCRERVGQNV